MSHFTVLVVGSDPEKQLAPFHEFECTGCDNEFVLDVDQTEEVQKQIEEEGSLKEGLEYFGLEQVSDESEIDRREKHKFGYAVVKNGTLIKAVNRTNPNRKWDWYQLGGRWTGFFRLKKAFAATTVVGERGLMTGEPERGTADRAFKREIDFDGMREEAGVKALKDWGGFHAVLAGRPLRTWTEIRESEQFKDDIEGARIEYHEQTALKEIQKAFKDRLMAPEEFLVPQDEYVQRKRSSSIQTFAVIHNGNWYERGSMGWWGCVSDEKDADEWTREYTALINSLSDDTLLSIYDCHI